MNKSNFVLSSYLVQFTPSATAVASAILLSDRFDGAFLLLCDERCLFGIGSARIRFGFNGRQTRYGQLIFLRRN